MRLALLDLYRREFAGYARTDAIADLLAGINVGAVSLPLALAFGVASGATAAAGLVTAIVSGIVMGALGGAPFQVSGPTGAMSAILVVIAAQYGLHMLWVAAAMAGLMILALGLLRMGRVVTLVPSPVVAGFTTGIALVIASGQLDNVLGLKLGSHPQQLDHLGAVIANLGDTNGYAVTVTGIVIACMVGLPRVHPRLPASLIGIITASLVADLLEWPVSQFGSIHRTILLPDRLDLSMVTPDAMVLMIGPAVSIAILASIKSLLCGTVGATISGVKLDNNQELIGLGVGNLLLPFLGGVPASAAVARTSVAARSGGRTRLVPIIHGLVLLAAALVAAPLLELVPVAALGGVLLVTSTRVNDISTMRFFVRRRLWHAVGVMVVTIGATYVLNLTQAILIGVGLSVMWFVRQASTIDVNRERVDPSRMEARGHVLRGHHPGVEVIYVTGPLYFGTVVTFIEAIDSVAPSTDLILSLRGMPTIDASGVQAIDEVIRRQQRGGGSVHLTGLQPSARRRLGRSGILEHLGPDRVHWGADQAIASIDAARHPEGAVSPPEAEATGR